MWGTYAESTDKKTSEKPASKDYINGKIKRTYNLIDTLTPAGKRMLIAIHNLSEENDFQPITREDIAKALKRPGNELGSWDRRLLNRICNLGLVGKGRQIMMYRRNEQLKPCGARYVYQMDINTAWRIAMIRQKSRKSRRNSRKHK